MDQILLQKDRKKHTPLENYDAMNTPRTDAAILTEPYQIKELPFEVVKASKMAELETELQTMTALAERLAVIADNMRFVAYQPAVVREALAAYESHKKQTP